MTEDSGNPSSRRAVWVRGFYMLLLAVLWHVAEVVLLGMAIIQFIFALLGAPNERLTAFGGSLSRYLQQVAAYLTFASEALPFPFSDWPAGG